MPGLLKSIGQASITEIKLGQAAASRLLRGEVKKRPALSSWSAVLDYCRSAQAFAEKEQFRILFLDKRNHLIADEVRLTTAKSGQSRRSAEMTAAASIKNGSGPQK